MSFFSSNRKAVKLFLAVLFVLPLVTFSCSDSVGFGRAIDFEPPVLTLDRVPNPWYVNSGVILTGTVTDNVAVARVLLIDADPNYVLFVKKDPASGKDLINRKQKNANVPDYNSEERAIEAKITGERWEIVLNFHPDLNNIKLAVQIIAWDKAGNTGEESIQFANFFIDNTPPWFENTLIQRSVTRTATLWPLNGYYDNEKYIPGLKDLETTDRKADNIKNVEMYQNGAFWITSEVVEEETYPRSITLYLFDSENDEEGEEIYSAPYEGNRFAPQWTIKEGDLIATEKAISLGYEARLAEGDRIYIRVTIVAEDMANNKKREDFGYLCLYRDADNPKALLPRGMNQQIPPGTEIPVDFFDDDSLEEAYADLLRTDQFYSYGNEGATNEEILEIIRVKLINGEEVKNWNNVSITNQVTGNTTPESMTVVVKTGADTSACGEYKLVAFAKDCKDKPHDSSDSKTRAGSVWSSYEFDFLIYDNNAALIVIDTVNTNDPLYDEDAHLGFDIIAGATSGNSPMENTFPKLTDGRYFEISGYTLDANSQNSESGSGVDTVRMAWIPFNIHTAREGKQYTGQDAHLNFVRTALRTDSDYPDGVQHWSLENIDDYDNETSYFIKGTPQEISSISYTKHTFKKKFDILGGNDDLKGSSWNGKDYRNFYYNGERENHPKLFVIYAKNKNGNESYRTLRLLGNTNPPALKVYDFTTLDILTTSPNPDPSIWDPTNVNNQKDYYDDIKIAAGRPDLSDFEANAFTLYPNDGKIYKLYVVANEQTGVDIDVIRMYDASNTEIDMDDPDDPGIVGYVKDNKEITFVTPLPDIQQRVFKFYAKNKLGVTALVQRTISVSNTAQLNSIVTPSPSGVYSSDETIKLMAQFTGLVKVVAGSGGEVPQLNIRYEKAGYGNGSWEYVAVPFSGSITAGESEASVYLEFDWEVPENANGKLETVDSYNKSGIYDKPINLNTASIVDTEKDSPVFLPGTGVGYSLDWNNNPGNLQGGSQAGYTAREGKEIRLDGIRPNLTGLTLSGKPAGSKPSSQLTSTKAWHYFNKDDVIAFTLAADKNIRNSGAPRIEFEIKKPDGNIAGPYFAEYSKPSGARGMIFEIDVEKFDKDNLNVMGIIDIIGLNTAEGDVVDMVGNRLKADNLADEYNDKNVVYVIDAIPPPEPVIYLDVGNGSEELDDPSSIIKHNMNPVLIIEGKAEIDEEPWDSFLEYSLNDGGEWVVYPNARTGWTTNYNAELGENDEKLRILSDQWHLCVRQSDRADNEVWTKSFRLDIKSDFPEIIAIGIEQPNGNYLEGQKLEFTLDFKDPVYTINEDAYIIVADREVFATTNVVPSTGNSISWKKVPVVPKPYSQTDLNTTLTFAWDPIQEQHIPKGVTILEIHLEDNVRDAYGNLGVKSYKSVPYGKSFMDGATHRSEYDGKILIFKSPWEMPGSLNLGSPADKSKIYTVTNFNGQKTKVFTIPPQLINTIPKMVGLDGVTEANGGPNIVMAGDRKSITLEFDYEVKKETGTIAIKPHYSYETIGGVNYDTWPIPPVFPATGYEIDDASDPDNGVWVDGFFEVYNSNYIDSEAGKGIFAGLSADTLRSYLRVTKAITNITDSTGLSLIDGLDYGPYRFNTNGLIEGSGYSANATPGDSLENANPTIQDRAQAAWEKDDTGADGTKFMVPDTSGKYVLDFRYRINLTRGNAVTTETTVQPVLTGNALNRPSNYRDDVNNIRLALKAAHFRWQEMEVISGAVQIYGSVADAQAATNVKQEGQYGTVVRINLERPLNAGLKWDVTFTKGSFVDEAGVGAELKEGTYWFWTDKVQKPVIRVDRKSMDYRNLTERMTADNAWKGDASNDPDRNTASFNAAKFRVESETPDATISYVTLKGRSQTTGDTGLQYGAVQMNTWSGAVDGALASITANDRSWNQKGSNTNGTWLANNIVRRAKDGVAWNKTSSQGVNFYDPSVGIKYKVGDVDFEGRGCYYGIRSYNRDATKKQLDDHFATPATLGGVLTTPATKTSVEGELDLLGVSTLTAAIRPLKASKNYVIATASAPHAGNKTASGTGAYTAAVKKSYEGIFKTITVLNEPQNSGSNFLFAQGNGDKMITIFASDSMAPTPSTPGFPMMMPTVDTRYFKSINQDNRNQMYWISTEIVTPLFMCYGSHPNSSGLLANPTTRGGDAGSYNSGGYGELTHSYYQDRDCPK